MENQEKKPKSTKNTNAKDVDKKVPTSKASKANATTQDRAVKSNASKQSASKRGAKTEPKQTDEVVKGQEVAVDTADVERNSSSDDFSIQSQGERIKKNAGKNSKRKKAAIATAVVLLVTASVAIPTAVYLSRRKVSVDIANNIDIIQEYTINVNRGSTIKDIVPQEITGYTFVGFYKDAELTVPYKDTDKINKNMTIYAKYEANVYKVTFPTSPAFTIEGEDIVNNQVEIEYNTEYRFKLNLATGYDESDITVKVNGETVTPDQDGYYTLTIYGDTLVEVEGVEINTYEVTFYDSLEKNEMYQTLDIQYNQLCTYTGVTPTKHSTHTYTYTFIGWVDAEGNDVDLSTTHIVTDLELFANFREEYIEYTISKPEQVNVKFGDLYLSNTATLHYGDIVEITYDTTEGHDVTAFSVSGAEKVEGSENQYKITGNLVVTYSEEIQTFTVQIVSSNSEYGSINQPSITVEYGTEIIVSGNTLTIGEYTITATPTADDPTYDYVFVNWTNAVSEVTGDITITANFERTMDEYVVSIVVNNASYGTVNKASVIVNYNTPITVDGNKLTINGQEIIATATASDAQYTYTFTGWTNATDPITGNREITANFTRETNKYVVTILSGNTEYGSISMSSVTVDYGTTYTVEGNVLKFSDGQTVTATSEANTAQYTYAFDNWSSESGTITGTITITANFSRETNTYTVTWKNWDGSTLETDTLVPYGTTPEYNGENPTRAQDENYKYTFSGWDQEISPVTGDVTYTAEYATTNIYTVTFYDENRTTVLYTEKVLDGEDSKYLTTPTKEADKTYTYTFAGWETEAGDPAVLTGISGNLNVYASYSSTYIEYKISIENETTTEITIKRGEDTLSTLDTVHYGDELIITYTPTTGTDGILVVSGVENIRENTYRVTGNVEIAYTEDYIDYDIGNIPDNVTIKLEGEELTTEDVVHFGDKLEITYTVPEGYNGRIEVTGAVQQGESNIYVVKGELSVEYSQEIQKFTVTWKNWDGSTLETDTLVPYGTTPEYNGENPTRAQDENYKYTFSGWDQEISPVTGDVTYTAEYATTNIYTVTFYDENRTTVLYTEKVLDGEDSKYLTTPTKEADKTYTYTFAGWETEAGDPAVLTGISGNLNVYASYSSTYIEYDINISNSTGATLIIKKGTEELSEDSTVHYGDELTITYKESAGKEGTLQVNGATRREGTDEYVVAGDVTIIYSETYIEYTISSIPSQVTIKKGDEVLTTGNTLHYGDEISITYAPTTGKYMTEFEVIGATRQGETEIYIVTDNLTVRYEEEYIDYTIGIIPEGVKVERLGETLEDNAIIHYDDELKITYELDIGYDLVRFEIEGAIRQEETNIYKVEGNVTIRFEQRIQTYIVTIGVNNSEYGTVTESSITVDYGTTYTVEGNVLRFSDGKTVTATPETNTAQYTYTFLDWTSESGTVTGEATITANFTRETNTYTVSIQSNNAEYGTVTESSITVEYGTEIIVSGNTLTIGKYSITATPTADDPTYDYVFANWTNAVSEVTGDITITANFERTMDEYVVSIVVNNASYGTVSKASVIVNYNTPITVDGNKLTINGQEIIATATAGDAQYTYRFTGWTNATDPITEDREITANFTRETNTYTVSIQSNNAEYGTVTESSVTVEYGTEITVSGNTITIGDTTITATPTDDNPTYDYVFVNWTNAVSEVTGDITITANFERTMDEYVVSIVVNNASYGTVNKASVIVNYNTPITVDGNKLTINGQEIIATATASDAQYTYTFTGWTNATDPITGNREITANFTRETNKYVVTILSGNTEYGSISMSSVTVDYGTTYTVEGNVLKFSDGQTVTATSEANTAQYTYAFDNWSSESGTITGTTTITANFTRETNTYTVSIQSNNTGYGTVTEPSVTVEYGTTYTVEGNVLRFSDGQTVTATPEANTAQYTYAFDNWSSESGIVNGAMQITATFSRETNTYTVTWKNYDGSTLETDTSVPYGATPEYNGETPTYRDETYIYEFTGWDQEISPVTGDITYTAEYIQAYEILPYEINEDGEITKYTGSATEVVIPSSYSMLEDGTIIEGSDHTITGIDDASSSSEGAFANKNITSVTIGEGVTSIGNYAFAYCESLTSVTIPDSVTSIGSWAFLGCSSLTSINIPDSVTSIGYSAFRGCSSLTSITIGDGVTSIGTNAFYSCGSLTSVTIGDGVTSIGGFAFYDCTSLTEINFNATNMSDLPSNNFVFYNAGKDGEGIAVNIGANVTRIPAYLFNADINASYSPKITTVNFAEGSQCTEIGEGAFYECSSLTSINIPDSVTSIGENAFRYCTSLSSVTFENVYVWSVSTSQGGVGTQLSPANLQNSTTAAAYLKVTYSTYYWTREDVELLDFEINEAGEITKYTGSATEVVIPSSYSMLEDGTIIEGSDHTITGIADASSSSEGAFANTNITSVTIPEGVTSIGSYAFYRCSSLTSITIPDSVTSIGDYAFFNCYSLTSITIPNSVTSIEEYAFRDCDSLTSVTIGEGVTSIGVKAFSGCDSLVYVVNKSSVEFNVGDYGTSTSDNPILEIVSDESGVVFVDIDGNRYKDYNGERYFIKNLDGSTEIEIDSSCTQIYQYAFFYRDDITSVTIPNSVTSIGNNAFSGCSNLEYNIKDGIKYLSNETNQYLCLIDVENTSQSTYTIDENCRYIYSSAFSNCSRLTSITIPDSVTSIGNQAFYECTRLNSIIIGKSVSSIESSVFFGCDRLTSVTIESNYVYANAGTGYNQCGYLLLYATEVRVLKSCIGDSTNSYLENTANFTKTTSADGLYYIYTKI